MGTLRYAAFFFLICFIGCDNHEFPKSPYPVLETLPVVNIIDSGVTFQANLEQLADKEIIEHGFVWGVDPEIYFPSEGRISLGKISKTGIFETEVKGGMVIDRIYYVRAFVVTERYVKLGETVTFKSKGSSPPMITSVLPNEGSSGDTVIIKGHYFSGVERDNIIQFGTEMSVVLKSNDSTLVCIVPRLKAGEAHVVSIEVASKRTTAATDFNVLLPEITSLSPVTGIFGDTFTISGANFPLKREYVKLLLDGQTCAVQSLSRSKITFILPATLSKSVNSLKVDVPEVTLTAGEIRVKAPVVENVNNALLTQYENLPIEISGLNFCPDLSKNTVAIGGYSCSIISGGANSLTVLVPFELIPDRGLSVRDTFDLAIKVLDQTATISKKIIVSYLSTWTRLRDFPGNPRIFGASFSIGGKAYVGLGSGQEFDNWYNDFWEYDPVLDKWSQLPDFPAQARSKFVTLVIGTKAFIIGGVTGHNNNGIASDIGEVWEFDSISRTWTQKNDFPFGARFNGIGFTVNGSGFFGAGFSSGAPGYHYDFWKYNTAADNWTQLGDIPKDRLINSWDELNLAFSTGTKAYVLSGGSFMRYDDVLDQWKFDVSSLGTYYKEPTGFSLNGKVYAGTGIYYSEWPGSTIFFQFANNSWGFDFFRGEPRRTASSFVIGNYAYILLGRGDCHCANLIDVWRFDPTRP